MKYNENNIINVFDNISNYFKLITEMENSFEIPKTDNTNRLLDSLGADFRNTLENFKFDGYLNNKLTKQESKTIGVDYKQTIEKLAENIINLAQTGNFTGTNKYIKMKTLKQV